MEFTLVNTSIPRPGKTIITPNTAEQDLFVAIDRSDTALVSHLLDGGVDVNCKSEGWTPLTFACERGRDEITDIIITKLTAEENQQRQRKKKIGNHIYISSILDHFNDYGDTALTCAARNGHLDICCNLVHAGACANQTTQYVHQTPLHVAIEYGHVDIVEFLLSQGADVQITDNVNIAPLYTAVKGRNSVIVEKLIDAGCDVNIGSQDHSPLFLAARLGLFSVVKMLCNAGCKKDLSLKFGLTALYEATLKGHTDIVEFLITEGCDVNKTDMYGVSPLHVACMCGNLQAVDLLLQGGANPILKMQQGQTALQIAMETNKALIVEYLLKRGADILMKPYGSKSLSSIAAVFERGHINTVEVLLHGCPKLPLPHYPGVTEVFCKNPRLMKMLFLSGIQTIPGVLTVARLHPGHVEDKEISDWLKNYQKHPLSLKSLCRVRIRRSLGNKLLCNVNVLPLPKLLKDFVCLYDI